MTLLIAILVLLNLLVFGIRAYAHSLKAAERHQISRLRHSTQVLTFFTRHPKILNGPHSKRAWRIVHYHQRIIRHATRRLIAIRQRMQRHLSPRAAIRQVFGPYADQAIRVSSCETGGTFSVYARNGQYLGLFQMGDYARGRYGHSWTPLGQARAAHRYFVDSGRTWGPWECKP